MSRRDLVVLAADKHMEHALRGLLSRHKSPRTSTLWPVGQREGRGSAGG